MAQLKHDAALHSCSLFSPSIVGLSCFSTYNLIFQSCFRSSDEMVILIYQAKPHLFSELNSLELVKISQSRE